MGRVQNIPAWAVMSWWKSKRHLGHSLGQGPPRNPSLASWCSMHTDYFISIRFNTIFPLFFQNALLGQQQEEQQEKQVILLSLKCWTSLQSRWAMNAHCCRTRLHTWKMRRRGCICDWFVSAPKRKLNCRKVLHSGCVFVSSWWDFAGGSLPSPECVVSIFWHHQLREHWKIVLCYPINPKTGHSSGKQHHIHLLIIGNLLGFCLRRKFAKIFFWDDKLVRQLPDSFTCKPGRKWNNFHILHLPCLNSFFLCSF